MDDIVHTSTSDSSLLALSARVMSTPADMNMQIDWSGQNSLFFSLNYDFGPWVEVNPDFLTTNPVAEPATMLLLASGLIELAGLRRRFTRNTNLIERSNIK